MSFVVWVIRPALENTLGTDFTNEELEAWTREAVLLEEPLGADESVYAFWSAPAAALDLPLLGNLYQHGLRVRGENQLDRLETECVHLQTYWTSHLEQLQQHWVQPRCFPLDGYLQERLDNVRRAIALARKHSAVLSIS